MELFGKPQMTTAVRITAGFLALKLKESAPCTEGTCDETCCCLKDGDLTLKTPSAICMHLATQERKQHNLLGHNAEEEKKLAEFVTLAEGLNQKLMHTVGPIMCPKMAESFNKEQNQAARAALKQALVELNDTLLPRTFLVGERISLADIMVYAAISRIFSTVYTKEEVSGLQNLVRWASTIAAVDEVKKVIKTLEFAKKPLAEEPGQHQEAAKASNDEDDEEKKVVPAAAAPAYTFDMYAWKKHYKNLNWEGGAHWEPYFWEHYKPEEFSFFLCTYQYPQYLTEGLKAKNMIMVWLQKLRAEKCDKDSFGNVLVTKVESEKTFQVVAIFIFPGTEVPTAVLETMGTASYKFERMDPLDDEAKKFISSVWNWQEDEDIVYKGVNYGKTYDGETWH